jgi:dsRNA-specific ribonuclease
MADLGGKGKEAESSAGSRSTMQSERRKKLMKVIELYAGRFAVLVLSMLPNLDEKVDEVFSHKFTGKDNGKATNESLDFLGDKIYGMTLADTLTRFGIATTNAAALSSYSTYYVNREFQKRAFVHLGLDTTLTALSAHEARYGTVRFFHFKSTLLEALVGFLHVNVDPPSAVTFIRNVLADFCTERSGKSSYIWQ